jgi:hypothetical protein
MHESIDESSNFMIICFLRGENAQLLRNFNVICSVHKFFHVFSKLLPQSLKFRGWNRFDGIRRIHSITVILHNPRVIFSQHCYWGREFDIYVERKFFDVERKPFVYKFLFSTRLWRRNRFRQVLGAQSTYQICLSI